jgi:hypothetical protein
MPRVRVRVRVCEFLLIRQEFFTMFDSPLLKHSGNIYFIQIGYHLAKLDVNEFLKYITGMGKCNFKSIFKALIIV